MACSAISLQCGTPIGRGRGVRKKSNFSSTAILPCASFPFDEQERTLKILVIGAGGREHALCWKLAQSPKTSALYACPGNPGMASVATCLATSDYLLAAESIDVDLTVVGP